MPYGILRQEDRLAPLLPAAILLVLYSLMIV
jgi:hypothetical protein